MTDKTTYVYLTGGLGNQLFQVAAACNVENILSHTLVLDWQLGACRLNNTGLPEIQSLIFPKLQMEFADRKIDSVFIRRLHSLGLRIGSKNLLGWHQKFILMLLTFLLSCANSLHYRKLIRAVIANGLGYSKIPESRFNLYLIGYFQSHKYLETDEVFDIFSKSVLRDSPSDKSAAFFAKTNLNHSLPLICHIRRTDYLNEKDFGVLDSNYYARAIKNISQDATFSEIWLFSDNAEEAVSMLADISPKILRVFSEGDFSTSESFMLMRLGGSFVLANSSFGWWAAALAHIQLPKVIYPDPWFTGMEDPNLLFPRSWQPLSRH
jgi:hypothetical protein